jgi:hypothetical protein
MLGILPYSHIQYAKVIFMHSIVYKYGPKSFLETLQTNINCDQPDDLRNHEHFKIPFPRIELFNKIAILFLTNRMEPTR